MKETELTAEKQGTVSDEQKLRLSSMWDSLKRFDIYIGTVNFKSGLLTTLNAAVFGGIVLKADSFIKNGSYYQILVIAILAVIAMLSLLSIYYVIKSIWPILASASTGTKSSRSPSVFFFGSISRDFTAAEFVDTVQQKTAAELERDLIVQVHEVAVITDLKFKIIAKAARLTVWNLIFLLCFGFVQILEVTGYHLCHG
ncbi:Pycsar system effector family protein [Pseudomonas viridiflava]|uniref:Pycsar system effector family protein n=2 Tax=Pseudomonas viridiflava TaxID=33069 RepID=UPI000F01F5A5|nr:Pycsar system effector family protein [Pseudomonas viridiflava]